MMRKIDYDDFIATFSNNVANERRTLTVPIVCQQFCSPNEQEKQHRKKTTDNNNMKNGYL